MLTRRIAASVCTLCLVIPAAAGATIATPQDTVKATGPAGATIATPQGTIAAKGPAGATMDTSQGTIAAKGPAGATMDTSQGTIAAKGPAGATMATGPRPYATRATAHAAGTSNRDGTNGWRTAAISEAALLAALALGSALLLPARLAPRAW